MKDFILNFTKIVEKNPRVYWSIIFGVVGCLALFVVEAFHVQHLLSTLNTTDQNLMKAAVEPLSLIYGWLRILVLILTVVWSNLEYRKAKKALGLI